MIYYYIKLKRGVSNDLIEEILNFVKGGHYIVSFVDEIEDDNELNAEVIEIEEEKYYILKNLN